MSFGHICVRKEVCKDYRGRRQDAWALFERKVNSQTIRHVHGVRRYRRLGNLECKILRCFRSFYPFPLFLCFFFFCFYSAVVPVAFSLFFPMNHFCNFLPHPAIHILKYLMKIRVITLDVLNLPPSLTPPLLFCSCHVVVARLEVAPHQITHA